MQFRFEKLEGILDPRTAGLSVLDAFGEGRSDLLAWSRAGIRLYRTGRRLVEHTGLEGVKDVTGLAPGDIDNDSWIDIGFSGSSGAALALNRNGRADLAAVASDGSLRLLLNRTGTRNRWLRVALDGVKNLRTGAGAEVEVKAGDHYQKKTYDGAPVLFRLGSRREVDTVRITWPNGLIQNQVREKTSRAVIYKEAPRLAGSCPMVFAWDGREFQLISDVLRVAPLGASSGDGNYFPVDTDEYIQLPAGALAPRDGQYEIRIAEELHEVTCLDKARLVAVDHPGTVEVFTNDKFKSPPFPEFRLFGVQRRVGPIAARDDRGRNLLPAVLRQDRVYAAGFRHDAGGRAETHVLDLKFPVEAAQENRSILILNGWIDWADGSTFPGASQGGPGLVMPYLQVRDAGGAWRTVIEDMGVPSGGPKTIVVDPTGKFLSSGREIRIVTNVCLFWDEIFLSEDTAPPSVRMTALEASLSDLRLRGFSRSIVDPNRERPEGFDYAHWEPQAMWNPVPGLYTRYGDVSELTRECEYCVWRQRRAAAIPWHEPVSLPCRRAVSGRRRAPGLAQPVQYPPGNEAHRTAYQEDGSRGETAGVIIYRSGRSRVQHHTLLETIRCCADGRRRSRRRGGGSLHSNL